MEIILAISLLALVLLAGGLLSAPLRSSATAQHAHGLTVDQIRRRLEIEAARSRRRAAHGVVTWH